MTTLQYPSLDQPFSDFAEYFQQTPPPHPITGIEHPRRWLWQGKTIESEMAFNGQLKKLIPDTIEDTERAILIWVGIGAGQLLLNAELDEFRAIVLFEPNLDLLHAAIYSEPKILELIESPHIILCHNYTILRNNIMKTAHHKFKMFTCIHPYHVMTMNTDFLQNLIRMVATERQRGLFMVQATANITEETTKNVWQNMGHFPKTPPVSRTFNQFKDVPALICSAGPSMDLAIPYLEELKETTLIFAASRIANTFEVAKTSPHAYFIVDFMECVHDFLADCTHLDQSYLALATQVHKGAFEHKPRDFCIYTGIGATQKHWIKKYINPNLEGVETGGSVSCSMLSAAIAMGCNPIIMIGQDLCFKDHFFAKSDKGPQTRGEFEDSNMLPIKNHLDEDVYTQPDLVEFMYWFEAKARRELKKNPDLLLFNASTGGVGLQGFEHKSIEDILAWIKENRSSRDLLAELDEIMSTSNTHNGTQKSPKSH